MPIKRVVGIAGLETLWDAKQKCWKHSDTFLNNLLTYKKDHPFEEIKIFDCRDYKEMNNPMKELWRDLSRIDKIDLLIYSGHSSSNKLFVYFRYPEQKPDEQRFITKLTDWSLIPLSDQSEIVLWGCQTLGQNGKRVDECIGQWIADATKRPVWGFTSRTSQKLVDGKFYMRGSTKIEMVKPR